MHFFLTYAIVLVIGLSVYLFKSNYITFSDFVESYNFISDLIKRSSKSTGTENQIDRVGENSDTDETDFKLTKSLRHLEFVNGLEAYAESSNDCPLSIDCLKELENSKLNAQLAALKSALELSTCYNTKAA